MKRLVLWLVGLLLLACFALQFGASVYVRADEEARADSAYEPVDDRLSLDVPREVRRWFYNFTNPGSCVQCSIGMCAVDQNVPAASTLLMKTEYGPPEYHGSGPDRVSAYCRSRGIKAWNVTGETTFDWMAWACRNGRGVAIGAGRQHFQTLVGHDPKAGIWYVCNNNSPTRIDRYDDEAFRRLHLASGRWCVVLDAPPHPGRFFYDPYWADGNSR